MVPRAKSKNSGLRALQTVLYGAMERPDSPNDVVPAAEPESPIAAMAELGPEVAQFHAESIAEQRRRVFEGLAPEIQRNPKIRARFGLPPVEEVVEEESTSVGLGDAIAVLAKPIAKLLRRDPDCLPCQRRRAMFNRALSIKLPKRRTRGPI